MGSKFDSLVSSQAPIKAARIAGSPNFKIIVLLANFPTKLSLNKLLSR